MKGIGLLFARILVLFVAPYLTVATMTPVFPEHDVPHDANCFTEGLVLHNGVIYESCGESGNSTLHAIDPHTGKIMNSITLPDAYFGEGVTAHEGYLYVATWKSGTIFIYNTSDLNMVGVKNYSTFTREGWGLTTDGMHLILGDGSSRLNYFLIPNISTFGVQDELIKVKELVVEDERTHKPVEAINELEYASGYIYANLWMQDTVVKINAKSGVVTHTFDLSILRRDSMLAEEEEEKAEEEEEGKKWGKGGGGGGAEEVAERERERHTVWLNEACSNGIAYNPTTDTFILTGKLWPKYYTVKLDAPHSLTIFWELLMWGLLAAVLYIGVSAKSRFTAAHEPLPGVGASGVSRSDYVAL